MQFKSPQAFTIKQLKFVKQMLKTGNPTGAAMDVYDTTKRNVASAIASENLRKLNVREAIEEGLASEGLTPGYIFGKLKRVLDKGSEAKATAGDRRQRRQNPAQSSRDSRQRSDGGSLGMTSKLTA